MRGSLLQNASRAVAILACIMAGACGSDSHSTGQESALAGAATPEQIARGATLFTALGCPVCHRDDDGAPGARLRGIAGTTVTLTDGRSVLRDREYLARAIRQPEIDSVPGASVVMPPYDKLSGDDLAALVVYVESL